MSGILSVKEFQEKLEDYVKKGVLPLPPVYDWQAKYIYDAYKTIENKQAKHALLIQLADVLVKLQLRNPAKRFEKLIEKTGISKSFAKKLLIAYSNQMDYTEVKNGEKEKCNCA